MEKVNLIELSQSMLWAGQKLIKGKESIFSADSSCINTIDSIRYEHVNCRECGRKARVLVSNSVKNPGRLYYGCIAHGWVKWVIPAMLENEYDFQPLRRRIATERREAAKNVDCNCNGIFWALVMTILVLIVANLFVLLIWLIKA